MFGINQIKVMTEGSVSQIRAKIKVVFLGDQSTGKTSIIMRFVNNRFDADTGPTVGIDFLAKNINVFNSVVRLQLWDTAGQQRFRSLIPNYLKDSLVSLLVFDLSNRKTFENLVEWIELYNQNHNQKSVLFLVGNKSDLQIREISFEQATTKAKQLKVEYVETSAKTGSNIQKLFIQVAKAVVKDSLINSSAVTNSEDKASTRNKSHSPELQRKSSKQDSKLQDRPSVRLSQPPTEKKKKGKCC